MRVELRLAWGRGEGRHGLVGGGEQTGSARPIWREAYLDKSSASFCDMKYVVYFTRC